MTTGRQVPSSLFTDREPARIGLTETKANVQGRPFRLFKVPMEANLRVRTLSETRGFMKAVVEAESERILGFTLSESERGDHGLRAGCDDRWTALYRLARYRLNPPYVAGGFDSTLHICRGVAQLG